MQLQLEWTVSEQTLQRLDKAALIISQVGQVNGNYISKVGSSFVGFFKKKKYKINCRPIKHTKQSLLRTSIILCCHEM